MPTPNYFVPFKLTTNFRPTHVKGGTSKTSQTLINAKMRRKEDRRKKTKDVMYTVSLRLIVVEEAFTWLVRFILLFISFKKSNFLVPSFLFHKLS